MRTPLPTRQRRPAYVAVGLLLVVGLAVTFGWMSSTAGGKVLVVVVRAPVAVGEVVDRSDVSTVDVAGELTAIAGAALDSVVGQRAAVGLLPGTILQRSMLTDADPTPAGMVQVGITVTGGRLPAGGVAPGPAPCGSEPGGGDPNEPCSGGFWSDIVRSPSVRGWRGFEACSRTHPP